MFPWRNGKIPKHTIFIYRVNQQVKQVKQLNANSMKKILFLSALALGLMTSCSEDEQLSLPTVGSNTIAFATHSANKPMTRSGATITTLSKFTVDAVNTDNTTFFSNLHYS